MRSLVSNLDLLPEVLRGLKALKDLKALCLRRRPLLPPIVFLSPPQPSLMPVLLDSNLKLMQVLLDSNLGQVPVSVDSNLGLMSQELAGLDPMSNSLMPILLDSNLELMSQELAGLDPMSNSLMPILLDSNLELVSQGLTGLTDLQDWSRLFLPPPLYPLQTHSQVGQRGHFPTR